MGIYGDIWGDRGRCWGINGRFLLGGDVWVIQWIHVDIGDTVDIGG